MKTFIVFAVLLVATSALPFEVFENENGDEFVVLPLHRERRDTTWGVNQGGYGVGQKGTIFNDPSHRVDGSVTASKAWGSHGLRPDTVGGRVDYSHKPSGSGAFISADKTRGYGTDLSAGAKYNFAQGKNWGADISGQYDRHYGGPGGTGKARPGAFLNVHGNF